MFRDRSNFGLSHKVQFLGYVRRVQLFFMCRLGARNKLSRIGGRGRAASVGRRRIVSEGGSVCVAAAKAGLGAWRPNPSFKRTAPMLAPLVVLFVGVWHRAAA